jgi:hypothetical protein
LMRSNSRSMSSAAEGSAAFNSFKASRATMALAENRRHYRAAAPGSCGMRGGFRPGVQCRDWGHRRAGGRREPGRRGLLSGERLLFAGALILVVAQ